MANEAQEPKYDKVTFEQAEAACRQAAAAADEREEAAIEWAKVEPSPVQKLDEAAFSKCVGQSFEAEGEGGKATLVLAEVVPMGEAVDLGTGGPGTQSQFSAVFNCPGEPLPEGLYTLRNDDLGELHLRLEPVAGSSQVEAVFS